jgi:NitT/TauT family transport system substrate-binding protein
MKRIITAAVAALLFVSSLFARPASETAPAQNTGEPYVVKFAYSKGICHAPLHAALLKGFFEAEGLPFEAIELSDLTLLTEAATKGDIDAGYGAVAKFIKPIEDGAPYLITSGIHTGCAKLVAKYDSSIHTITDLRGKKIGLTDFYDASAIGLRNALEKAGVGGRDDNLGVQLVKYPSAADIAAAFESGAIDAYYQHDPQTTIDADDNKVRVVIDSANFEPDEYCCITFVTEQFAKNHPAEARKYTKAVLNATKWLAGHQDELTALEIQEGYGSGDPAINARIIKGYDYLPSVAGGFKAFVDIVNDIDRLGLLDPKTDKYELIRTHYYKID